MAIMEQEWDLMTDDEVCKESTRLHGLSLDAMVKWTKEGIHNDELYRAMMQAELNYHEQRTYACRRFLDAHDARIRRNAAIVV